LGWLSIQFAGTVTDTKAEKHANEGIETSPAFAHLGIDRAASQQAVARRHRSGCNASGGVDVGNRSRRRRIRSIATLPCAPPALSLHDFPAETTTNVSQQILFVKPKYYLTCLYIDSGPTPLSVRLIENFNLTHPTPPG
jgi:hypothetical protein